MKYICDVTNTPILENCNVSIEMDCRDHENSLDWREGHKQMRQRLMVDQEVAKYLIYFIKSGKFNDLYKKSNKKEEYSLWLSLFSEDHEVKNA